MNVKISALVSWGVILVLGQLLITTWTVHAAGNKSVIDYISFAGTVVGMILAILAIVYSFISNASQKSDADMLRLQLFSLNEAISRADASGEQFASELGKLEEIRLALSKVALNSEQSLAVSSRLEQSFDYLKSQTINKERQSNSSGNGEVGSLLDAAIYIASHAVTDQVIMYFLAIEADFIERDELARSTKELIGPIYKSAKDYDLLSSYKSGELLAYNLILSDLDVFESNDNLRKFMVSLLDRANTMIDRGPSAFDADEDHYDVGGLLSSIAAVAQRLRIKIDEERINKV